MGWQPDARYPGYFVNEHGQFATAQQLYPPAAPAPQQQQLPPAQYAPQPQQAFGPGQAGYPPQQQYGASPAPYAQPGQASAPKPIPAFYEPTSNVLPQQGFSSKGEVLYIDFPKLANVNDTAVLMLRFLPAHTEADRFVTVYEHRLPIEFEAMAQQQPQQTPQQGRSGRAPRMHFYVVCPDFGDGPKGCRICGVRKPLQGASLDAFKNLVWSRKRIRHLALNVNDLGAHWQQVKDAQGAPVMVNGQPQWVLMPGVFSIGPEGYGSISEVQAMSAGPIDSLERGTLVQIMKRKTGVGTNEVSYRADRGQEFPLRGTQYESVLQNIYPLRERLVKYRSNEELTKFAEMISARLGGGQTAYGMPSMPSPGYGASPGMPSPGMPYGAPAPSYGAPQQPQGYGAPPQQAPQYGAPPQQAPAYGAPPQQQSYGPPPGQPQQQAPQTGPGWGPPGQQPAPQFAPQGQGGPPMSAPQQFMPPPAPAPMNPAQLPHAPAYQGQLPPAQAPGMHAVHIPQGQPQGGYGPPPPMGAPQGGPPPMQAPQGGPPGQPPQQQSLPYGAPPPMQQQVAPGTPPAMSPADLERMVTPSGGTINF